MVHQLASTPKPVHQETMAVAPPGALHWDSWDFPVSKVAKRLPSAPPGLTRQATPDEVRAYAHRRAVVASV